MSGAAEANGRFPRAQRLVESSDRAEVLALYGTYGLLVTRDGGTTWQHVCEAATGPYTGEDPLLEILPGDRLFVRTEVTLVVSGDTWCDWQPVLGEEAGVVQDITRDPTDPEVVLALTSRFDGAEGYSAALVESPNGGATWSPPLAIPRNLVTRGLTLDVAPSMPARVYATGIDDMAAGKILVSDERGRSWQEYAIAGTGGRAAPYIAAVSRVDPGRIFVRTDAYEEFDGIDTAYDSLLVSIDGGQTFTRIIQREAKLFGFALSPDESTLLVGFGDPVYAATYVEPEHLGIYRASMADVLGDLANASDHFEKIFEGSVTCLRWSASGLFACTSQGQKGFEVGRAADASFGLADPAPFAALLRLGEVSPLPCAAGTQGHACYTNTTDGFPAVCRVLGASCDAGPPAITPDADGAAGGAGAVDASLSTGGAANDAGDADGAAPPNAEAGADGDGARTSESSSCACRLSRSPGHGQGGVIVLLVVVAFAARRPRQGSGRPRT